MIFLSECRKNHETKVKINNNNEENISFAEPNAIWENIAPDMAKKKPA